MDMVHPSVHTVLQSTGLMWRGESQTYGGRANKWGGGQLPATPHFNHWY